MPPISPEKCARWAALTATCFGQGVGPLVVGVINDALKNVIRTGERPVPTGLDPAEPLVANPTDSLREGVVVKVQAQPSKS